MSYHSAFLGAALHCSRHFSAGMVSIVGLRPPKLASGMSSSRRSLLSMLAMALLYPWLIIATHTLVLSSTAHALHDPQSPTKPFLCSLWLHCVSLCQWRMQDFLKEGSITLSCAKRTRNFWSDAHFQLKPCLFSIVLERNLLPYLSIHLFPI